MRAFRNSPMFVEFLAAGVVMFMVLAVGVGASGAEDKAVEDKDVAVVETQIGLGQIVVKKSEPEANPALPPGLPAPAGPSVAEAAVVPAEKKEDNVAQIPAPAAPDKVEVTTTAAPEPAATDAEASGDPQLKNFEIGSAEVVQMNRSLKKMIETNSRLEEKNKELQQQLLNSRGQQRIELTRMEKVKKERDDLIAERDAVLKQGEDNKKEADRIAEEENKYKREIEKLKVQLAEKEKTLQAVLVEPRPLAEGEAAPTGEGQVVMKAQEVVDMRDVIRKLSEEISQKEEALKKTADGQKAQMAAAQRDYDARVNDLSAKLAAKEQELADLKKVQEGALAAAKTDEKEEQEMSSQELPSEKVQQLAAVSDEKTEEISREIPSPSRGGAEAIDPNSLPLVRLGRMSVFDRFVSLRGAGRRSNLDDKKDCFTPSGFAMTRESSHLTQSVVGRRGDDAHRPELVEGARGGADETAAMQDRRNSLQVMAMIDTLNTQKDQIKADEGLVHYNMGNVFFRQGQFKRAADEYRQAVILRPEDANAHFNLAFVSAEHLFDPATALEHFRLYLWLNPEAPDKALVQEKIVAAKMDLGAELKSGLEKDLRDQDLESFGR